MRASIVTFVLAVVLVTSASASQGGFVSTLSTEQLQATGIATLTPAERDALNAQVAGELALARQGDVRGFAGTFSSRRKPAEFKASGLNRLTKEQLGALDDIVRALLAAGPVQRHIGRELTNEEVSRAHKRFETHGSVSYTIGGGGGRSFQGGTVSTVILYTQTGSTIGFSYSQFNGDPFLYYGGGYYDGSLSGIGAGRCGGFTRFGGHWRH